ncbi:peroxidase-like [Sipha flava]|uniref:Peroxidase n=1 Tax=Sipha flava TaxID=143950 RepID=A0A2S2QB91_9HEMI|nr:peroxidase-like [Sipha flava]XP_025410650.1 peroxidase-like [Sipha flava]
MGSLFQSDENKPLLERKINSNTKWNSKPFFKWGLIIFVLCLIFFVVIFVILKNVNQQVPSATTEKSQTTKHKLHISSVDTTYNDYLMQCAPRVKCDPNAKYRRINGSCNNLVKPTLGASKTPFLRMLKANYADGYYELRNQTNGSALPSARVVDINVFLTREKYHVDENNVLLLPFSQLLAHDLSGLTNDVPENEFNVVTDCCTDKNARKTFSQCQLVVENPPDDPVYSKHNIFCMGLVRSLTSRNYSCPLYPTTFMNDNTHFIDASNVYGSTDTDARRLRLMEGGRLNFSIGDNGQMFCPYQQKKKYEPVELQHTSFQYDSGDPTNGNQNLGIGVMQTAFLRFHNYIAFKLMALNPYWSDETLYQESRRIVIATIQRIVYNDLLPIIIGEDYQQIYGINKENIYDPTVNPSMALELSSAAIRVLHAIIPVQFNFMNNEYEITSSENITDWMLRPVLLPIKDNFDKLLKGFLETPGRMVQPSYNFYISNYLFSFPGKPRYTGRDLLALDIARGRDVGLQPYIKVKHLCGLPLAKSFADLEDLIHIRDINKLKELYHSVDDIDLIVGLLLEKISDGAIVGPTTQCLIADGFYRYKAGDRFFYDVQGQPGSFTPEQFKIIKKITLGHVICAISNVNHVQKDIFKLVDHNLFSTSKLKCDDEFYLSFEEWTESNDRQEL